jgi:glycosyltransferase involved in cell wall biosynthesis
MLKILFDNVNFQSLSGPNSFGRKLASVLINKKHKLVGVNDNPDIQLSFIQTTNKVTNLVQRLDGIYFNTDQDWHHLNQSIYETYKIADAVVFQSNFNKKLTENFFGVAKDSYVIHNGTDINMIKSVPKLQHITLDKFEDVWCCASNWRPHKRLEENIHYFLEHTEENSCLVVAGDVANLNYGLNSSRVIFVGNLDWIQLISLYKRSKHFIHLSFLDHCPNVVVDARAAGCHIICSSSGGTKEIAGKNSTIIQDIDWDFRPLKLYSPPRLDYTKKFEYNYDSNIDINYTSGQYLDVFYNILRNK